MLIQLNVIVNTCIPEYFVKRLAQLDLNSFMLCSYGLSQQNDVYNDVVLFKEEDATGCRFIFITQKMNCFQLFHLKTSRIDRFSAKEKPFYNGVHLKYAVMVLLTCIYNFQHKVSPGGPTDSVHSPLSA